METPPASAAYLHCFTGEWDHARRAIDGGFLSCFAGNMRFPKRGPSGTPPRKCASTSNVIETDAPFLAPIPRGSDRNEARLGARGSG